MSERQGYHPPRHAPQRRFERFRRRDARGSGDRDRSGDRGSHHDASHDASHHERPGLHHVTWRDAGRSRAGDLAPPRRVARSRGPAAPQSRSAVRGVGDRRHDEPHDRQARPRVLVPHASAPELEPLPPGFPTTAKDSRSTSSSGCSTRRRGLRANAPASTRRAGSCSSASRPSHRRTTRRTSTSPSARSATRSAKGGYTRAVIGNGDGLVVDTDVTTYRRFAVNALMGSDGTVPGRTGRRVAPRTRRRGTVRRARRPRHDRQRVHGTRGSRSRSCSSRRPTSRASATSRPLRHRRSASACTRTRCERTDELVGRLLEEVDPTRDAVLVVGTGPEQLRRRAHHRRVARPGRARASSTRPARAGPASCSSPTSARPSSTSSASPRDKEMSGSPFVAKAGGRRRRAPRGT